MIGENKHFFDIISDKTISQPKGMLDYTVNSSYAMQELVRKPDFSDRDAELIFYYLQGQIKSVAFNDYLKRFLIRHFEIPTDISVSDKTYKQLLASSFRETGTPKSFHDTTTSLGVLINKWLKAGSVTRETVFLLGFALTMTVEEVSRFLTKGIREQDFNFNNPEETVFWYCYNNGFRAKKALELLKDFEDMEKGEKVVLEPNTITNRKRALNVKSEEDIRNYLFEIAVNNKGKRFSTTAQNLFANLVEEAKAEISKLYNSYDYAVDDNVENRKAKESDIEKVLYSGVPLDEKGNLLKASMSNLDKEFAQYRLSRQRINNLLSGKRAVTRQDIITSSFLIASLKSTGDAIDTYTSFIKETDALLHECYMGRLNISNPYEAFIVVCLLTENPLGTFSDVWEMAYDEGEM